MKLIDKLFGHGQTKDESMFDDDPLILSEPVPCPHGVLTPHWETIADLGREELATSYVCESCGAVFSPEEAKLLRSTEAQRFEQLTRPGDVSAGDSPYQT